MEMPSKNAWKGMGRLYSTVVLLNCFTKKILSGKFRCVLSSQAGEAGQLTQKRTGLN